MKYLVSVLTLVFVLTFVPCVMANAPSFAGHHIAERANSLSLSGSAATDIVALAESYGIEITNEQEREDAKKLVAVLRKNRSEISISRKKLEVLELLTKGAKDSDEQIGQIITALEGKMPGITVRLVQNCRSTGLYDSISTALNPKEMLVEMALQDTLGGAFAVINAVILANDQQLREFAKVYEQKVLQEQ